MSSAAGIPRRIPFTFLNSPKTNVHRVVPNPKVLVLIVVTLLLSVQLLQIAALQIPRSDDQDENTVRCALVTSSFTISPTTVYVGQTVYFFANASSDLGTGLTFTIYYDYLLSDGVTQNPYSPVSVNMTGNPGSIMQTHVYEWPGNISDNIFAVALLVYDGFTTKRTTKFVTVLEGNRAPVFQDSLAQSYPAQIGVPLEFSVTVRDDDNDALNLTWDFGDGTPPVVQSTGPAAAGVVCNQSHAWNPPPELIYGISGATIYYRLSLSLEDGHDQYMNTTTQIYINLPYNFSPQGNLTTASATVDPGDTVTICATATDPEGEPLTWTFIFNNSACVYHTEVFHTALSEPGTTQYLNFTHNFTEPGYYSISFYLSDVWLPENQTGAHNVSAGSIQVSSVVNSIPVVIEYIQVFPTDVQINETTGVAQALFRIQANDYDGEVLTATWCFGDGSPSVVNVTQGGPQVYTLDQAHEFLAAGQYNVSVTVTDGRSGHEVVRYKLLNITSNNSAPQVTDFDIVLSNTDHGLPGSVVQFVIVIFDRERDMLTVSWDFGDGSPIEWTNATLYSKTGNATFTINHTYAEEGDYTVIVCFTDGMYSSSGLHEDSWSGFVRIEVRAEDVVRVWDWWDYSSLTLFIISIGLLFLWSVSGVMRRRRLDRMGVTLEEYQLRKLELTKYEEKHKGEEGLR
jgi:hypothetical protein